VKNLSAGGLFIETPRTQRLGATANLHFLVQEGQIRANAEVRHVKPGGGLGLKFKAVGEKDRPNLAALMRRLRSLSWLQTDVQHWRRAPTLSNHAFQPNRSRAVVRRVIDKKRFDVFCVYSSSKTSSGNDETSSANFPSSITPISAARPIVVCSVTMRHN
jgi:hypothetical protein